MFQHLVIQRISRSLGAGRHSEDSWIRPSFLQLRKLVSTAVDLLRGPALFLNPSFDIHRPQTFSLSRVYHLEAEYEACQRLKEQLFGKSGIARCRGCRHEPLAALRVSRVSTPLSASRGTLDYERQTVRSPGIKLRRQNPSRSPMTIFIIKGSRCGYGYQAMSLPRCVDVSHSCESERDV